MGGLQTIADYLRWWGDPAGAHLFGALANAKKGAREREQAALQFNAQAASLPISPWPEQNQAVLNLILGASPDLILRDLLLGAGQLPAQMCYIDKMVKEDQVTLILDNLMGRLREETFPSAPAELERHLLRRCITATEVQTVRTMEDLIRGMLTGQSMLLVRGLTVAIQIATPGWEHRQPEDPVTEPVVRGPKEGFTETAAVNLSLVRVRLSDPRLRVERFTIGERTHTKVYLVYLAGLALPEIVDEVRSRLKDIRIDGILESGYLQEMIEDHPWTPFPLMKVTERPDVVTAELLEGKVAVLTNGSPGALTMPTTFAAGMQAAEDYYEHWPMATFTRLLRYLFLVIALTGPSVYIAITTFHHEMLPTDLLLSIMGAREGVPFPAAVEAMIMELSFEALREAGIRLPRPVGQAVSIVGALVIGEAAVRAGLVSPILVIVVAITGISSFVIPLYSTALAVRLLRFPMMILAGTFGFYGISLGLLLLSVHLAALRSFGVPYMAPTMPPTAEDMKDLMIRVPWWAMRKRPKHIPTPDRVRQWRWNRPTPPTRQ